MALSSSSSSSEGKSSSAVPSRSSRPYDLIIYGATGFTGQLAFEYVHEHYNNQKKSEGMIKYAIAGRNADKLARLRSRVCDKEQQPDGQALRNN